MLRKVLLVLTLLISLGLIWAQGAETFANSTATASYADGSFVGDSGVTWTFGHSRNEETYPIDTNGLMLRRASDSYLMATLSGGLGSFTFQYRKAFTGTAVRQLELYVNDTVVGTTAEFGTTSGAETAIHTMTVDNINLTGNVTVKIKNVGVTTTNRQVTLDNISWTGFTGGSSPTITTTGTLNGFSTYTGSPSSSQSYTLTGGNLTANILVTAPAGYELSTDNSSFNSSLSLAPTYNNLVYVRLTGATAGSFAGDITHTSTGATQVNLAVTGTVTQPTPTINVSGTLNPFSTFVGTPSAVQTYTLSGVFLTTNIGISAPAGFEVSADGTSYATTASVAPSFNGLIYVRLAGTTVGSYAGNIQHTSTGATQVDLAVSGEVTQPLGPTTFIDENFIYTAGTTLVSNGWIAHSGAGANSPIVHDTGLIYPSYPAAYGLSARILGNGEDVHKNFDPSHSPATSGSVYSSFLINVTNTIEAGGYVFHMNTNIDTTTDYKARLHVARDASNNVRFGLTKSANTATTIPWTGYDYALNTTYLVVLKYEFVAGATNDIVTAWINPVIGPTEPTPTLTAVVSETDIGSSGVGAVGIRQSSDLITAVFDGIRVTNDWALLWSGEAPPTPEIIVTGTPDYLYSIAGSPTDPGEITSYQLSGDNLAGNITVTAPEHFEVSVNGVDGWAASIQVGPTFSGSIYVRLNTATVGAHGGDIVHASSGADPVNLRVDGEALAPDVIWNITNNMTAFTAVQDEPSNIQSYSLSATNASANLVLGVTGPFELSLNGTDGWTAAMSLQPTFNGNIYVRMLTTAAGTYDGTILHTTANASNYPIELLGTVDPPAGIYATDLFFSEYIEGSSNNKAIEIFNGTGVPVDMTPYKVVLYSNGSATPGNTLTFPTGRMLAHNDVYVIANSSAVPEILAQSDTTSTVTYFNGDDAVALVKIVEGVDTYVDIFGRIGEDPGSAWTADGGYSTVEKTLVRKPTVTTGVSVNPASGFPTLATEWDVYAQDTVSYLGSHTFTPGMDIAAAPVILPAGGLQSGPVNVTMSSTTPGAVIYYTLDGSIPTDASLNYSVTGSFAVSTTTTVKAITYATGYAPSAVSEVEYIYPTQVNTIAALRAMPSGDGTIYQLASEAVLTFQQSTRHQKYIQDATAAIVIDDAAGVITTIYNLYDGITGVTGTLGVYNGLLQFTPVVNTAPATSTGNVIVPEVRTLASLTTDDQAKLIKVMNVTVDPTLVNFPATASNINATDPTATLVLRTFPATDYSGTAIPTTPVNITCLAGQYNTTMQISPRFLADFEPFGTLLPPQGVSISKNGTQLTISWNAVDGATSYKVEVSGQPYTGYLELITTSNLSYTFEMTPGDDMKFYQVRAIQ